MAYIFVNKSKLRTFADISKQIGGRVRSIENDFSSVGRSLDWDIKVASGIDATISQVNKDLNRYAKTLDKVSNFIIHSYNEYNKLDIESIATIQKATESTAITPENKSIINDILGWFGKQAIKTGKKFIIPIAVNLLPKGLIKNALIWGNVALSNKSTASLAWKTIERIYGYKRLNLFTKGTWRNLGKSVKTDASKIASKFPYAEEYAKFKQISNFAKRAIPSKTGAKWLSSLKSAAKQATNNAIKVIKTGIKKQAYIGGVIEVGTGLYYGIKNKNSLTQIFKGVGFDAVKGAAAGVAAFAAGAAVSAAIIAVSPVLIPSAAVAGVVAVGGSIIAGAATTSLIDYVVGSSDGSGGRFFKNKNGEKVTIRDLATGDNDSHIKYQKDKDKIGAAVQVNVTTPNSACPVY